MRFTALRTAPPVAVAPPRLTTAIKSFASRLATPLVPDDFLSVFDPLWSAADMCARVEGVRPEAAGATTLLLRPGRGWTGHRAGQFLPVGVDIEGVRTWRTYSLSSPPGADRVAVTVKAVPGGKVSVRLARGTVPGDVLRIGPAGGDFVLPHRPGPLLFVTGGSGITPVAAILRSLVRSPTADGPLDAVLVHSARTHAEMIFGADLRSLAAGTPGLRLHERHTADEGRLTPEGLARLCPDWADRRAYACGPEPMLAALEAHWAAAGRALRTERFRLPAPDPARVGAASRIRFARSGREAATDGRTPILAVGERAGVAMPHGCRQGVCHGCLAPLRSGRVRDLRDGRESDRPGDLVQTCVTVPVGPVVLEL